jgi:thioredoxin-like negative regulator of GroEL
MAQLKRNPELSLLHLLYYRPTSATCTALDRKLFDLAARHRGALRLVVKHSDECGHLFGGWVSGTAPTVLFVLEGRTVAEMVGDLPTHEMERLLRSSLSGVRSLADARPDDPDRAGLGGITARDRARQTAARAL